MERLKTEMISELIHLAIPQQYPAFAGKHEHIVANTGTAEQHLLSPVSILVNNRCLEKIIVILPEPEQGVLCLTLPQWIFILSF